MATKCRKCNWEICVCCLPSILFCFVIVKYLRKVPKCIRIQNRIINHLEISIAIIAKEIWFFCSVLCTRQKWWGEILGMSDADNNVSTKIWSFRSRQMSKAHHMFQRRYFRRTLTMSIYTTLEGCPNNSNPKLQHQRYPYRSSSSNTESVINSCFNLKEPILSIFFQTSRDFGITRKLIFFP